MQISAPKKPQGTAALYVSLHTEKSGGVEREIKKRAVARGECAPYHGFIFLHFGSSYYEVHGTAKAIGKQNDVD